jgi:hypothetical protein
LIIAAMATAGGRSTVDHMSKCDSSAMCEVLFGTVWVTPTSYSLYSSAISVLVQVWTPSPITSSRTIMCALGPLTCLLY